MLFGIQSATTANFSFCSPKEPLQPADFMPSQIAEKHKPKRKSKRKSRAAEEEARIRNMRCFLMAQAQIRNNPTQ